MYLYFMHDYTNYIKFNLTEEFSMGYHKYNLSHLFEFISNDPPEKPSTPSGPNRGKTGNYYTYSFTGFDPNNDRIFYLIDWGDKIPSYWLGPYKSNESCEISYRWEKSNIYGIKVKM